MSAVTLMADIVILNMFLVVACLPVVTVGAAVRAANVVVRDMIQGVGSRYWLRFLRELTSHWKPATIYWLLLVVLLGLLAYQQFVVFQAGVSGFALTVIQALVLSGLFLIMGVTVWFYGLASSRPAPFGPLLIDATLSTLRHLPHTLGAVVVLAAGVWGVVALPIGWAVPLTVFLLPALTIYVIRLIIAGPLGETLGA
ncbi:DUF624 domain-containing protein [Corynebacterium sp. HMSC29G08]|uniref:DUF624 domain-containing protein n=1 Tax=Corynebacterium sp. HMSC29G08 TaxID=1581069 RepID=UPI0008A48E79|nr:DUF624 domain-containing protein [Corynebacterium sp. HMSC29G08]